MLVHTVGIYTYGMVMMKKKPDVNKIAAYFDVSPVRAYRASDLAALQVENAETWKVPLRMGSRKFLAWLLENTQLRELTLKSPSYSSLVRYAWGANASALSVALSVKSSTFCSHGTALWLHGLGGTMKDIFVNAEQSEKSSDRQPLTQDAIHRAFRNKQRTSNLVYLFENARITVVNGKHTGRLEVAPAKASSGELVEVTSMERTLIDAAVRPSYAHGVAAVLRAFNLARGRISVTRLCEVLKKMDYTYPYHQAIGLYLKLAGYPPRDLLIPAHIPKKFEFYLCHGIKDPAFDTEWKVFFPRGLTLQ